MSTFDTVIEGGLVVDGTGAPAMCADVGIRDGRIAKIGRLKNRDAIDRIDARGKIVAPGHVTQHSHYDAALFWDAYCSNSGENGVTTVTNSNCGFGIAPVRPGDIERTMHMLATTEQIPVAHQRAALPWDWESFPEYLARLAALPKGVNVLTFLPLNPLLVYVMGIDAAKTRQPTSDEMSQIHQLIHEAMDAGAVGISMSVMGAEGNTHIDSDGSPMPTDLLDHDVALEIGRAVVERGEGIIQMLSQVMFFGDRSVTERMADMAKGSGVRVIHDTFLTHDLLPKIVDDDLAWLDSLRAKGCDLTVGCMINRGWFEAGLRQMEAAAGQLPSVRAIAACESDEEVMRLIQGPEFVRAFSKEYAEMGPVSGAAGLEGQTVLGVGADPNLSTCVGRTLGDLAQERGSGVVQLLIELAIQSNLAIELKSPQVSATDPSQAQAMMAHSAVIAGGSDGGAHTKTFGMGHYATDLLIWFVREENRVTLEDMHFQLSLKPARSLQLRDRGALLPGYWADILIYDLQKLYVDRTRYEIVHDMPNGDWRRKGRAGGYDQILVNGEVTHMADRSTGRTPGQLARITEKRERESRAAVA